MSREGLSAELVSILDRATSFAKGRDLDLYVVGGFVRDRLLGAEPADLDLVWVGAPDPKTVAVDFAAEFSTTANYRSGFLTASCEVDGVRVDLGRARAETYSGPAALPTVRSGSLEEDLLRRDFSVNAMAWPAGAARSQESGFAAIVDLCNGRPDLEARVLRSLHAGSFRDDPTRILRGVELAIRFGFEFADQTREQALSAVGSGKIALVSGTRLRHEIERLFADPTRAVAAAGKLRDLGLDSAIDAALRIGEPGLERVRRLAAERGRIDGESNNWLVILAVLLWERSAEDRESVAERLALDRRERGFVMTAPARVQDAIVALRAVEWPAMELVSRCARLSALELGLLEVLAEPCELTRFKEIKALLAIELQIGGDELVEAGTPPGPAIGDALARTLTARRSGEISADQELAFALDCVNGPGDEQRA